jgi:hypothetical protein
MIQRFTYYFYLLIWQAAQCGTSACSREGCSDEAFFQCFATKEAEKKAFAEDYPQVCGAGCGG